MATAKQIMRRIKKRDEYLKKSGTIGGTPRRVRKKKKR